MKYTIFLLLFWGASHSLAQSVQLIIQPVLGRLGESTLVVQNPAAETVRASFRLELEGNLSLIGTSPGGTGVLNSPVVSLTPGGQRFSLSELFPELGVGMDLNTAHELCVEAYSPEQVLLARTCQTLPRIPTIPPHLVYPFEGETVATPFPVFSWTAPQPLSQEVPVFYTLRLVELHDFQTPEVAISQSIVLFQQTWLSQNLLPYPATAPTLEPGHHYAWQVEAFRQGQTLGFTEVWTFEVENPGETDAQQHANYVQLRDRIGPGAYPARGRVCFRFDPQYGEKMPEVHIVDGENQSIPVRDHRLEKTGENLFILDLPPGSGLKEGSYYVLAVTNAKGETQQLRFRYLYSK